MPGECTRSLAPSAGERTAAHALRPRGLHVAAATCAAGVAEQTRDLCPFIPRQCRDAHRGRPRSHASRRRDRVLQRPPYLEPEAPSSSACSLCGSRRRPGFGPLAVDRLAAEVLPAGGCAQRSVPGQVRGRSQNAACPAQTQFLRSRFPTIDSSLWPMAWSLFAGAIPLTTTRSV